MADIAFRFDEHLSHAVVKGVRRAGIVVKTAHELGRCGLPDETQLRLASADNLVMVTHDTDYLDWAADFHIRGEFFAGVAFGLAQKYKSRPGLLIRELITLAGVYSAEDMHNHVEYL